MAKKCLVYAESAKFSTFFQGFYFLDGIRTSRVVLEKGGKGGVALAGVEECLHVNKQTGSFPCLVCLCGFTFIFFGAFTGKHTAGNNWLVDRLRRPAHKPGQHECRGLCASFRCHPPP